MKILRKIKQRPKLFGDGFEHLTADAGISELVITGDHCKYGVLPGCQIPTQR